MAELSAQNLQPNDSAHSLAKYPSVPASMLVPGFAYYGSFAPTSTLTPDLPEFEVRLAANSCVTKNIYEAGDYGGFPAVPIHEWRMEVVSVRQTSKEFWHNRKTKFTSDIPIPST